MVKTVNGMIMKDLKLIFALKDVQNQTLKQNLNGVNEMNEPELKGELEVIVNYMQSGLVKTRLNDVKEAELPVVLRDLFIAVMKVIVEAKKGKVPNNAMALFSEEQFKQI